MEFPRQRFGGALPEGAAMQVLARSPFSLIVTDPHLEDNPIVFVNAAFERATGYGCDEVVGRNCRFLQGDGTDPAAVAKIRKAVEDRTEVMVDILNYRRDGTPFWNRLLLAPLFGPSGKIQYFSGIQKVLKQSEAPGNVSLAINELQHRVKNHLSMVVGLLRLHARDAAPGMEHTLDAVSRRVEGLAQLYEQLSYRDGENHNAVVLSDYLQRVTDAVVRLSGRTGTRVSFSSDRFTVPVETALPVGLIYSEIVTNAMQHALAGREDGELKVRIWETDDHGICLTVEDNGAGFPADASWPNGASLGGKLITQFCRTLEATLDVETSPSGTTITLSAPPSVRDPQ